MTMTDPTKPNITVTDAPGRVLALKRPSVLTQLKLIEILGDTSKNETFMNVVMPALYVKSIDGDEDLMVGTRRQLDALIQRLDEDGLAAISEGIREHFLANSSLEQAEVTIKNSSATAA